MIYFPLSAATKNECFELQAVVDLKHIILQKTFLHICSVGTAHGRQHTLELQAKLYMRLPALPSGPTFEVQGKYFALFK